jgi:hypothetical protein
LAKRASSDAANEMPPLPCPQTQRAFKELLVQPPSAQLGRAANSDAALFSAFVLASARMEDTASFNLGVEALRPSLSSIEASPVNAFAKSSKSSTMSSSYTTKSGKTDIRTDLEPSSKITFNWEARLTPADARRSASAVTIAPWSTLRPAAREPVAMARSESICRDVTRPQRSGTYLLKKVLAPARAYMVAYT